MRIDFNTLPASWEDVTVEQYLKLRRLPDDADDLDAVTILLGLTPEEMLEEDEYSLMLAGQCISAFVDQPLPTGDVKHFIFRGVTYRVPDNLEDQMIGAYSDWLSIASKNTEHITDFIPGTLAFFCRPEGEAFDTVKAIEREKLFHHLPIHIANSIAGFFLQRQEELKTSMQVHLMRAKMAKMPSPWRSLWLKACLEALVFIRRCSGWPKAICQRWMRSGTLGVWVRCITCWHMNGKRTDSRRHFRKWQKKGA